MNCVFKAHTAVIRYSLQVNVVRTVSVFVVWVRVVLKLHTVISLRVIRLLTYTRMKRAAMSVIRFVHMKIKAVAVLQAANR